MKKAIAILYQGRKQDTSELAHWIAPQLKAQGHDVRVIDMRDEGETQADCRLDECDFVLVLGGDGYMEPDEAVWIDRRSMLHAELQQDGEREEFLALNDVVIARGTWPRMVEIHIWVDDYFYNKTFADGIILCTATGSTAYNMAVGGPLLHPQVESCVLTPIAPHLAFDRSLILQPEARVKLQIFTGKQGGVFSADGQMNRDIKSEATVTVRKSEYEAHFLRRRPPTHFYQIISAKLREDS